MRNWRAVALAVWLAIWLAAGAVAADVARANTDGPVKDTDDLLAEHLRRAWMAVERGHSNREAALLIVPDGAGGWRAVPVFDAESYQTIRLEVPPGTLAILHTHPNHLGGEPSIADRRNSELLGIPNFTLTDRGVWRYDPRTRRTERVMYMLSWLEAGTWERMLRAQGGQW
jgi:hypothetical protein